MTFLELAAARWTCRSYDSRPVEQEKIDAVLEAARLAPTAKNFQPQRIWVLRSEDAMERIRRVTPCIYGAPVAFIVGYSADEAFTRDDGKCFGEIDATIALTHLLLEAHEQGLGGTWIGWYDAALLRELFPEIEGYVDISLAAIGYPAVDAEPADLHRLSKSIDEFVTEL